MLGTKPCLYCRGRSCAHYIIKNPVPRRAYDHFHVRCGECGSQGPMSESKEGAIRHWNHRRGEIDSRKIISDLLYKLRNQILLHVRSALRTNYSADIEELYLAINKAYDLTGDTVLLISEILLKLRTGE